MRLSGTLMRGGTSKCWMFSGEHLLGRSAGPSPDEILLAAFGSVDESQIDGVGGGKSTTSKAAFIRGTEDIEADIEYLFAQVGTASSVVEWASNCGNCASAVALYALQSGLAEVRADCSVVTMRNINTGDLLRARILTPGGVVPDDGDATVAGSRAHGVAVELSFVDPVGSTTGALLPTGNVIDDIEGVRFTLADAGAPIALADARGLGAHASEPMSEFAAIVPRLAELRRLAAVRMGLRDWDAPDQASVPKVGIAGRPRRYCTTRGDPVDPSDYDLAVRMVSMRQPHPALGLTSAVGIAAAAAAAGTVPAMLAEDRLDPSVLRLATPAGVLEALVSIGPGGRVTSVGFRRAARRIADAIIWVPRLASIPEKTNASACAWAQRGRTMPEVSARKPVGNKL